MCNTSWFEDSLQAQFHDLGLTRRLHRVVGAGKSIEKLGHRWAYGEREFRGQQANDTQGLLRVLLRRRQAHPRGHDQGELVSTMNRAQFEMISLKVRLLEWEKSESACVGA